ncbi:hypothetical protein MJT46_013567 [Ovis ammon polii x Ovis aries]|nr:hypothetical protein MJT46_013567 [Ovis ammon polii x Ovis aries]
MPARKPEVPPNGRWCLASARLQIAAVKLFDVSVMSSSLHRYRTLTQLNLPVHILAAASFLILRIRTFYCTAEQMNRYDLEKSLNSWYDVSCPISFAVTSPTMSKEIYSSTAPGVFLRILGDFSSGGYFPLQTRLSFLLGLQLLEDKAVSVFISLIPRTEEVFMKWIGRNGNGLLNSEVSHVSLSHEPKQRVLVAEFVSGTEMNPEAERGHRIISYRISGIKKRTKVIIFTLGKIERLTDQHMTKEQAHVKVSVLTLRQQRTLLVAQTAMQIDVRQVYVSPGGDRLKYWELCISDGL